MNDNMVINGDFSSGEFTPWNVRGHVDIVKYELGNVVRRKLNVPQDDTSSLTQILDATRISPGRNSFFMQVWGVATHIPPPFESLFGTLMFSIDYIDPDTGNLIRDSAVRTATFTKEAKYEAWRLDFDIPAARAERCVISFSGGEIDTQDAAECLAGRFVVVATDPGSTLEWPERR